MSNQAAVLHIRCLNYTKLYMYPILFFLICTGLNSKFQLLTFFYLLRPRDIDLVITLPDWSKLVLYNLFSLQLDHFCIT